ncbi:ribonuclease Y [candidate division WWE3 bacterium]|nr:ribonuclease Y [candidate division WWE3 bacterium]
MSGLVFGIIISALVSGGAVYLVLESKKDKGVSKSDEPVVPSMEGEPEEKEAAEVAVKEETPITEQVDEATLAKANLAKQHLIREAKNRAKEILLEAKDKGLEIVNEAEEKARQAKNEAAGLEKDLAVREAKIESHEEDIKEKAAALKQAREAIEKRQEDIDQLFHKQKKKLQEVSSLTREEAREILLKRFDKELAEEKSKRIRELEKEIKEKADSKSQEILLEALRHGSTDYIVEHTTSKVKLADPDMKGRIIGKEGRNIKTFEKLTGVELDLDDSSGDITVSCFDSVRREIGKIALERLIADGRIQPARIEDIVEQTRKDIEHIIYKEGDKLCHMLGVYDLPKDLVRTLGKFKYRFSYGQNMTKHTLEVAKIGISLAQQLNADVDVVRMGCLLHDVGKVLGDGKGSHVDLGLDYLKEHGVSQDVLACVKEHHEDDYSSIEAAIVALADHISGARPGARSEDYESFSQRMRDLEEAATAFDGVEKAYAISSGREVRVFVEPDKVDDASTALLAREIARKIELEQTYPGVVNVTVIRETRKMETAR